MKKKAFLSGALAVSFMISTALTFTPAASADSSDNWVLTWADEFDKGSLDMTKWSYDIGNWKLDEKGNYETNGWGNNEQEFYTDKNTEVSDGTLKIYAKKEQYSDPVQGNYDYTSAKLITQGKFDMCYGKVDIRARVDSGKSLWPALWMLPTDSVYGRWAASGEIDIMEGWGSTPEKVCGTIHFGDTWPGNTYLTENYTFSGGDSTENWHNYSVEWEPGEIRWYIDDVLYSTQNKWNSAGRAFPAPFDQNFYLIMNLAVGGTFDGIDGVGAEPATFANGPKKMEVDYVRVYQKNGEAYTPDEPSQKYMKSYVMEGGDGSVSNSDSGTAVKVDSPGDKPYSIMACVENLKVKASKTYGIDFDIVSSSGRNFVLTAENSEYVRSLDETLSINGEKKHFHFDLTPDTDESLDIKFQFGNTDETAVSAGNHEILISDFEWTDPDVPKKDKNKDNKTQQSVSLTPYVMEGGSGTVLNSFDGITASIENTGDASYSVMAALENVMVLKDKTYCIDFDIRSSQDRNIELTIENSSYDRFFDELVYLTGEKKHFHFECTFPENMTSDLKFQLGKTGDESYSSHTIEITGISFKEKTGEYTDDTSDSSTEKTFQYGDLNLDGVADLTDLTLLSIQCMTGTAVSGEGLLNADVNADGMVDIADLATMKQYVSKDASVVLGIRK